MRREIFPAAALLLLALAVSTAQAQDTSSTSQTRPRTIGSQQQGTRPVPSPTPRTPATTQLPAANPPTNTTTTTQPPVSSTLPSQSASRTPLAPATSLAVSKVRARIQEAERIFRTRPQPTSLSPGRLSFVTLAALDPSTSQIHLITLPKDIFLRRGSEATVTTQLGATVSLRIIRANGVNTAVTVFESATNRSFVPLLVEYPIERNGYLREMAYYTSAHPALLSADIVNAGKAYTRTMLDLAARRLRDKGVFISPQILDIAERLLIVEHVDHTRFLRENRLALYEEIFSLYALNELKTYNYSVSTAGAGGLVQMIPSTYQMIRRLHPGIGLNPDFVLGMRNHGNALEAMLLYMYDVWNNLMSNSDVSYALSAKWATPADLMAAGYNSNPARLPLYIRRAGAGWRSQIPSETQMYLQIY
ncbi:MAG TPA: hypothetical protein VEQ40_04650, partial [Pyrinomonadaceae bacterium]|nr:hypothetical protein [Pyrinomonadaceae bacterium]